MAENKKYLDMPGLTYFYNQIKSKFASKTDVGTPSTASTIAAMTDHNKVYVYTGSETGHTFGDWYFYEDGAWHSGGRYMANVYETDKTLSITDKPADAKKTGDEIADLRSAFDQFEGISNEVKQALLICFSHVAWSNSNGRNYYDMLESALYDDDFYNTKVWDTNTLLVSNDQMAGTYNGTMGFGGHTAIRRGLFAKKGRKGILETQTLEETQYYPIPVPPLATKCTITLNNGMYLSVKKWHYYSETNSYSAAYYDSGWQPNSYVVDLTPAKNEFITINIKNGSAGTDAFSQEPTGSFVFDEGV